MMNGHARVFALTQIAFLNALILTFLSVQFVAPFTFVLFLWIIPAIFAFQIYQTTAKLFLYSCLLMTVLSFLLFGLDVGFWTMVYLLAGGMLGLCRRLGCHWLFRFTLVTATYIICMVTIVFIFAWITQITWSETVAAISHVDMLPFPLTLVIGIGLTIWALILVMANEWLFSRVLNQVQINSELAATSD